MNNRAALIGGISTSLASLLAPTIGAELTKEHFQDTPLYERNVSLKHVSNHGKDRVDVYADYNIELLAEKPEELAEIPEHLNAPLYGYLRFGRNPSPTPKDFLTAIEDSDSLMDKLWVILDRRIDGSFKLYVDSNMDKLIAEHDAVNFEATTHNEGTEYEHTRFTTTVAARVGSKDDFFLGGIDLYWFDERGQTLRERPLEIEASRNYVLEGVLPLKSGDIPFILDDMSLIGDMRGYLVGAESYITLKVDRNGNGFYDTRGEEYDTRAAFTIDGTTYRLFNISPSGQSLTLKEVDEDVPEITPSPNLNKGQIIPSFTAKTIDGKEVHFPDDFRDKIIFFDIWATWCGPCVAETIHQKNAYNEYKDKEIVFISLSIDKPERYQKLLDYIKKNDISHANWLHINDPGGWEGEIFDTFSTTGIPACFLIDGSSGRILSDESEVRGESLTATLRKHLSSR